jgi:glyoxylase-like metal-dependent hydrolase (beta-lactamase superfamily II)
MGGGRVDGGRSGAGHIAEPGVAGWDTGADQDESVPPGVVFSGDVLFAGTVGRTDLPGGDGAAMRATLRDVVGRLDETWQLLPGHGPASTVARERQTNPFLTDAW